MQRGIDRVMLFLGGAVLALLLIYAGSFQNGFHYDDFHSIVDNPHIRSLDRIPAFFLHPEMFSGMPERAMYRPLLLVSYALNYWAGGYAVWGYHLVNLGLHLGCALLVFLLGRSLGGGFSAAALGGLLFALHPVNAEVVNYISSRSESLASLFFLVSLLAYLRWRRDGSGWFLGGSLAAYACSLLSKSIAVVLPVALVAWELGGSRAKERRFPWRWQFTYWAVTGIYLLAASGWLRSSLSQPVRSPMTQVWTQVKAFCFYGQLLAMPVELSVEHGFTTGSGPLAPEVLAPLLLLLSGFLLVGRRQGAGRLLLGWAVLPLLPSSLVPLNVLVNEHRLYLPGAFLAVGAGLWLGAPVRRNRRRMALWGGALAVLGLLAWQRSRVWQDELSLWQDAVRKGPGMYRNHLHLGGVLEQQDRLEEALARYRQAAALAPEAVEPHYNLANALRRLQQGEAALAAYTRCLSLDPDYVPARLNLAGLHLERGELAAADSLLRQVLGVRPDVPEGHHQLGLLRKRQGRLAEAEQAFLRALALRPELAEARFNLGNLYVDQGRFAEAGGAYEGALAVRPGYGAAYRNLGDLYLRQGDFGRAAEVFSRGLRQAPGEVVLYYGLAQAQEGLGRNEAAAENYARFLAQAPLNPGAQAALRQRIRDLQKGGSEGDEARP